MTLDESTKSWQAGAMHGAIRAAHILQLLGRTTIRKAKPAGKAGRAEIREARNSEFRRDR